MGVLALTAVGTTRRARSGRGQGHELRSELLTAGHRLLDRTGDPASVTIRAVVGMVGVAPPALYRHFRGRRDLLAALVSERFSSLDFQLIGASDRAGAAPLDRLRFGLAAFVNFAIQNSGHYRILVDDDQCMHDAVEVLEALVESAFSRTLTDTLTRRCVTTALVAFAHGYVQVALSGRPEELPTPLEALDSLAAWSLAHTRAGRPASG